MPCLAAPALIQSSSLHRRLELLLAGGDDPPLTGLLVEQGYWLERLPAPDPGEQSLGDWWCRPDRLEWLCGLAPAGMLLEAYPNPYAPPAPQGHELQLYGLTSDGQEGWFYARRPGQDPCPGCLVRRWLQSLDRGGPELTRVVACGRRLAFAPVTPLARLQGAAAAACRLPGRLITFPRGPRQGQAVVALPGCTCQVDRPPRLRLVGRLGPVARLAAWKGTPVVGAELHPGPWATGGRPFPEAGGCHPDRRRARRAALGEALERYCASFTPAEARWLAPPDHPLFAWPFCPSSTADPDFPYRSPGSAVWGVPVEPLASPHEPIWAPLESVLLLRDPLPGGWVYPSLSHGLAAGASCERALTAGLAELIERDALVRFWVGGEGERFEDCVLIPGPAGVWTVWHRAMDGQGRIYSGSAAGPLPRAMQKARLEAEHNRHFLERKAPGPTPTPRTYDQHAAFYWHFPHLFPSERYRGLPRLRRLPASPSLRNLATRLLEGGWTLYRRDLTLPEARGAGLTVLRCLVEGWLAPPPAHDQWQEGLPRFPGGRPPWPHPFG